MTLHTRYHSKTWEVLVEAGWVTAHVNGKGVATMFYAKSR